MARHTLHHDIQAVQWSVRRYGKWETVVSSIRAQIVLEAVVGRPVVSCLHMTLRE